MRSSVLRSSPVCLVSALLALFVAAPSAYADDSLPAIWSPPICLSHQCGFIGDTARADAIGVHFGTNSAMRFSGSRRFAGLSGWAHGSLTFLDLITLGGALGGHFGRDEAGSAHTASAPAMLYFKLRGYPFPWRAGSDGLQVAMSFQRSFVSERLGKGEPPGFDVNTLRLLASRSFGPVDLDGGVGLLWGGQAPDLRRYVEGSLSARLRLYGLARPASPDEQLSVMAQALYRFALPGSGGPASEGYLLFGVEERTASGYGFGLAIGPQLLGARVGGLFMAHFTVSWGLRYRNPWAESMAGKRRIPRLWMDLFFIDPILQADGCVYTDPLPGVAPLLLKCIGTPSTENPKMIRLYTGGHVPIGTHLWVEDDGTLLDDDLMHVGHIDKELVPLVQASQALAKKLAEQEQATGQKCAYGADMLHGVRDWGLAMVLAGDSMGGAATLFATEIGRAIRCGDSKAMSGGGFLPLLARLPLKKGPMTYKGALLGQGEAEHTTPVQPAVAPPNHKTRAHLYHGNLKQGEAKGWHFEPTGDRSKGTYVIEETRTAPDKHGVYEANVVIEGVKKKPRSTFFPKDWTMAQVEKAIEEAYESRQPTQKPGRFQGTTSNGMSIEMDVDASGHITTAYPKYDRGS